MRKFLLILLSAVMCVSLAVALVACTGGKYVNNLSRGSASVSVSADSTSEEGSVSVSNDSPSESQSQSSEGGNGGGEQNPDDDEPIHVHHSTVYLSDGEYHWQVCEDDGEVFNKELHKTGETNTTHSLKEGSDCIHVTTYEAECSVCNKSVVLDTQEIEIHEYTVSITKEATCSEDGVKTYTCVHGDSSYTEYYENDGAHVYDSGVTENGITTYTCVHCDESYSVIDYKTETTATTTADTLANVGAIELKNATIALDNSVLDNLTDGENTVNVSITADTKTADDVSGIAADVKTAIGDNPVYDFTMTKDGSSVSQLGGKVTITLPYVLSEGEDPDCIVIWYLNGTQVEAIEAAYANGNVTFETDHFSYYTVVRLSREDTCKVYGHVFDITVHKDSTCAAQGYETYICRRCGEVKTEALELEDHEYKAVGGVASTSTRHGYIHYECVNCGDSYNEELPLERVLGDNYLENLLMSLIKGNLNMNEKETEYYKGKVENEQVNYSYIRRDALGFIQIASVSSYGGGKSIMFSDESNTYEYRFTSDGYFYYEIEDGNYAIPQIKQVFEAIEQVYYLVPQSLTDLVWNALVDVAFTVEQTEDTVVLTINLEKAVKAIDELLDGTVKDGIDYLLGEGTYDSLLSFVEFACSNKISYVLSGLEVIYGFDVDGIIDFATDMMSMTGFKIDVDEMLEQYGELTLLELLGPMMGATEDQPLTYEAIKAMIDNYALMNVSDLIPIQLPEELTVNWLYDYIAAMSGAVPSIDLKLTTEKSGKFVSAEVNVSLENPEDENQKRVVYVFVDKSDFDSKVFGYSDTDAFIKEVKYNVGLLEKPNNNNYELFVKDYLEKYKDDGLTFTYTERDGEVYLVSSKIPVKVKREVYKYCLYVYSSETNELLESEESVDGFDFDKFYEKYGENIYFGKDGYYGEEVSVLNYYYEIYFDSFGHYSVTGLVDNNKLYLDTYRYVRVFMESYEGSDYYESVEYDSDRFVVTYDLITKTYGYSYYRESSNSTHLYTFEYVTEEEYLKNTGKTNAPESRVENNGLTYVPVYYKRTCVLHPGEVEYDYLTNPYYDGQLLFRSYDYNYYEFDLSAYGVDVRLEGRYYYTAYGISADFYVVYWEDSDYVIRYYNRNDDITGALYNRYLSYLNASDKDKLNESDYTSYTSHGITATMVSLTYDGEFMVMTYKLFVGNTELGTFRYMYNDYHQSYDVEVVLKVDGCTTYTLSYCSKCGLYTTNSYSEHSFGDPIVEELVHYTATSNGLVKVTQVCSKCGFTQIYYVTTGCNHDETETIGDETVCKTCGFGWVTANGKPDLYLEFVGNDDDTLRFSFSFSMEFAVRYKGYIDVPDIICVGYYPESSGAISRSYYSLNSVDSKILQAVMSKYGNVISYYNVGWNADSWFNNTYKAVAQIAYYDADGNLQFVEGYSSYGYTQSSYISSGDRFYNGSIYYNYLCFDIEYLNEALEKLNSESATKYFIVVSVVDTRNGQAYEYVTD